MKNIIIITVILILNLNANNEIVNKHFSYAQNYYWLTLDEGIGSSTYFKTIKYLKMAKDENEKLKVTDIKNYTINNLNINTLEKELKTFYNISSLTMDGFFPMLKFVSTSFFFFPEKSRQHTLQKPADFIAVENASDTLAELMTMDTIDSMPKHIFFNTKNLNWNELAFYRFNSNGKFLTHLTQEVIVALDFSKELIDDYYDNKITPTIRKKLLDYAGSSEIIVVNITSSDVEKTDSSIAIYGTTYNANGLVENRSTIAYGYSIDERGNWTSIVLVHIFLILLVIVIVLSSKKTHTTVALSLLALPIIGFLVGRVLPWLITPTLGSIMPNSELYVLYTFWWVALLGISIIFVPIYAMDLIYNKISTYISLPSIAGKGGIIGLSVSAGTVAYLFIPFAFIYGSLLSPFELFYNYILVSIAILISGYATGKILDKNDKIDESYMLIFIVTSIAIFLSLMHNSFEIINIISLCVIVISAVLLFKTKIKIVNTEQINEDEIDTTNSNLGNMVKDPTYNEFSYYQNSLNKIKNKGTHNE